MTLQLVHDEPVTWDVTAEDITEGECEDCWSCPVARSLLRVLPPGLIPEVDANEISIHEYEPVTDGPGRVLWKAKTPDDVGDFICDFDMDEPVEPCTITATFRSVA